MSVLDTLSRYMTYGTNYIRGWFGISRPLGHRPSDDVVRAHEEKPWLSELIKTYSGAPFRRHFRFDNLTNETDEMRKRYRLALAEPSVKAAMLGKIFQVASLELRIIPKKKKDPVENLVADFCKLALSECEGGTTKIVWNIASGGLMDGWSLNEPVFKVGNQGDLKNKWVMTKFKAKDTKYLQPWVDQYNNVIGIQATRYNNGQVYDPKDYVIFQYLQFFENPTGMSDLRAANRAIFLKADIIRLRMTYLEKYTGPFVSGKYKDNTMRLEMEEALKKARAQGYINLPEACDVEILNLATAGTDDFKKAIEDLDKEIVISVYGAFLHMMEGNNSDARGNAAVGKSMSELFVWYLADLIAKTIKQQILPLLIVPNFGDQINIPDVVLEAVNPDVIVKDLAIDKILHEMGLELSKDDLYDRANRTPPKNDEDRLAATSVGNDPMNQGFNIGSDRFGKQNLGKQNAEEEKPKEQNTSPKEKESFKFSEQVSSIEGKNGERVEQLLTNSIQQGRQVLESIIRSALDRHMKTGGPSSPFFDDKEMNQLVDSIASSNSTADLLGRYYLHERMKRSASAGGVQLFSETYSFAELPKDFEPLPPVEAVAYFQSLVPTLGIDPQIFGTIQKRKAFTLALASEQTILDRVKEIIREDLQSGERKGSIEIDDFLDRMGVTRKNPQYGEMVYRTNAMDALNTAYEEERMSPEMLSFFPVWQYLGIDDNRAGEDHKPHFGKYYPASVSFAQVRGDRVFNCRCTPRAIDRYEWSELLKKGAKLESSW